jgi:hypothetical protein
LHAAPLPLQAALDRVTELDSDASHHAARLAALRQVLARLAPRVPR